MRQSILILEAAAGVLLAPQIAAAQLETFPLTFASQTLRVTAFGLSTGDVVGGSSVGTSWNFGNEDGSTVGSVTSELIDGELVITLVGALSRGATSTPAWVNIGLELTAFGFVVPSSGGPFFVQLTKVDSEFVGPVEFGSFSTNPDVAQYSSQVLGGLASIGYYYTDLLPGGASVALPLDPLILNDTVEIPAWILSHGLRNSVQNSTGTFSETYTLRLITPVPEPSASLTIPSGAAMLLGLSKLRSASLTR